MVEKQSFYLDTICSIKIDAGHKALLNEADAILKYYDTYFSRYRKGSFVSKLNRKRVTGNKKILYFYDYYMKLPSVVREHYKINLAYLLDLWDFNHGGKIPKKNEIKNALKILKNERIVVKDGKLYITGKSGFDLGGLLKGVLLDEISQLFKKNGAKKYIINLGGDIAVFSALPYLWNIGIKNPYGEGIITYISVNKKEFFLVTSGDYERYFIKNGKRYNHIMDPHTGYPARYYKSVTVISDQGIKADILSTAIFSMKEDVAKRFFNTFTQNDAALLITTNREFIPSKNLKESKDEEGTIFYYFGK